MSHWLDLRDFELTLERILRADTDSIFFTAFDASEDLRVYQAQAIASGQDQPESFHVTALHQAPLSAWGAPGPAHCFEDWAYQVLYGFEGEGLVTRLVGLPVPKASEVVAGQVQQSQIPMLLLELAGEHTLVLLDQETLLSFAVDIEAIPSAHMVKAHGLQQDKGFLPLEKGGCFEQWPIVAPREAVQPVARGWALWEDCTVEDYERAESALTGGTQSDESIWSLHFERQGNTLIGDRMPLYTADANGWARMIGQDAKGRLWYRTGTIVAGQIFESLWTQALTPEVPSETPNAAPLLVALPKAIERYKRHSEAMATKAYDSHQFLPSPTGFALYQTKRSQASIDVMALYGDTLVLRVDAPGPRTHFEGKWQEGVVCSSWMEGSETGFNEHVLYRPAGDDSPWHIIEGATCALKGGWLVLCSKSW